MKRPKERGKGSEDLELDPRFSDSAAAEIQIAVGLESHLPTLHNVVRLVIVRKSNSNCSISCFGLFIFKNLLLYR